jgi:large subunit ribosomal protein L24
MGKLSVKKGDKVLVISGKDRGKQGKILRCFPKEERVIVEDANVAKKTVKPTQSNPQGGIIDRENPIHISNVQLICTSCGKPTRVGKRRQADGTVIRVCRKCDSDIDKS